MQIIISSHARERIVERLQCKKHKIEKIARKAFYSKIQVKNSYKLCQRRSGHGRNKTYKYFLGFMFSFAYDGPGIVKLITIYKIRRTNNVALKV